MNNGTLHTKHRPRDFDGVIGHKSVVKSLKKILAEGRSQCFIFTGPSGTGKTTLGRIIAWHVGCDPANLIEVDAATNTGIDAMRSVAETTMFGAIGKSPVRVIIIDEAHMLSKQAWNSLLKPIEEPPKNTFWILCTTESMKIPETIRTRASTFDLKPVDTDPIYELLIKVADEEKFKTPDDVLYLLAEKSHGSVRRALVGLAQCAECETRKDALRLLKSADEEGEVIDLCRALAQGITWAKAMEIVKPLKDLGGESIRIVVAAYFTKALMDCKDEQRAVKILNILQPFLNPYPPGAGIGHVVTSLAEVIFES